VKEERQPNIPVPLNHLWKPIPHLSGARFIENTYIVCNLPITSPLTFYFLSEIADGQRTSQFPNPQFDEVA